MKSLRGQGLSRLSCMLMLANPASGFMAPLDGVLYQLTKKKPVILGVLARLKVYPAAR